MAVLLGILALIFYWKVLFTNRGSFPWDASDFFYPYLAFVHEEMRHLHLPLWDRFVFSGFPIIGDPEAQIFYLPNWLMLLVHPFRHLPFRLVEIQMISHFLLAGFLMFYLARDFTRNKYSALLGGILYMFSGPMVAHTEHVASIEANAWYPLVVLLARRGLLDNKLHYTLAAGIVFGIENLAGHWQHAAYLGLLLFLYFAYEACFGTQRRVLWPRWIYMLGLIAVTGAGLSMVQVLPTYELGQLSVRNFLTHWDVTQGNPPRFLWTLFLPNYLGGLKGVPYAAGVEPSMNYAFLTVPGCLLGLIGLVAMARRRNYFWLGIIVLCTDLSFGRDGLLARFLYDIPVLNLFRQAAVYFDLANFSLCLMAAVGVQALFSIDSRKFSRRWLPAVLAAFLLSATLLGLILRSVRQIHGWYPMLAALAISCIAIMALLWNKLAPHWAQLAIFGLIVFQFFYYSRNQPFNFSHSNPAGSMAYDSVSDRKESIRFLRSDAGGDFRVAAFGESQWNNGSNVWRIPGVFGWNPIQLRNYQEYVRQFIHLSFFTLPYGGPDHNLNSPMLDLLGVKYVVALSPNLESMGLSGSAKFDRVFSDLDWWIIFRNKDYLSRAWFYPRAYVLPDTAALLALMNSQWFQARRTLLLAKDEQPPGDWPQAEALDTIHITAGQITASSIGQVNTDADCVLPDTKFMYWMGKGNWVRFDFNGPADPGRYILLMEYAAAGDALPSLNTELTRQSDKQSSGPVRLQRSSSWSCAGTRTADLGQFEIGPGTHRLTLSLAADPGIDLYSLWLVRLPAAEFDPGAFSFRNFRVSANHYAFEAKLDQQGYVLVNEIDYPGWEATLDGKPTQIVRSDGIFRGLWIPPGTHHIEMRFRPRYLLAGAAVSLISLAAVFAALMRLRPPRRRNLRGQAPP